MRCLELLATVVVVVVISGACQSTADRSSPSTRVAPTNRQPAPANPCGLSPNDWCPSPPGDPCGAHHDTTSCKADPTCVGVPYRGESAVACHLDPRGFADNCPTVGCVTH